MSKVSAGGGKQGKSGKSRSKGSGADIVSSRTESLATSRNTGVVTLLRKALRNDDGTERDLLAELPSFTKYARNGLDLAIEFKVGKELEKRDAKACFEMSKAHMEGEYTASGYGWDDDDKWGEITSRESRLLLVHDNLGGADGAQKRCVGFVSFRATLQGECWNAMEGSPCLFLYDVQLDAAYRRKGVGKQLLLTLEMMARKAKLSYVSALVTSAAETAPRFFTSVKGWADDTAAAMGMDAADPDDDTFKVYAKCLDAGVLQAKADTQATQQLAMQLAMQLAAQKPPAAEPAKKGKAAEPKEVVRAKEDEAPQAAAPPAAEAEEAKAKSKNAKKKAKQKAKKAAGNAEEVAATEDAKAEATWDEVSAEEAAEAAAAVVAEEKAEVAPPPAPGTAVAAEKTAAAGATAAPEVSKALNFSFNVAGLFSGTAAADDAAAAAEDDEEGGEDDDIDRVIGELCEMFEAEHGRAPTDDEVKIWVSQINEANLAGASG